MKTKFCKSLSNAVSFRIPGDSNLLTFNPCCLYNTYLPFHPSYFNKMRTTFDEATTFLKDCSKCELKERTHNTSLRIVSNREIPDNIGNDIYKLEIVLDTTCNAACIQCGADQSSLWRKEIAGQQKIIHIQPENQIDEKIEKIKQVVDINKVKIFHFWGGEPLLTNTHLKFLESIENPSEVQINYTSNASIFPKDEVLELWSKFKKVKIGLSIDGIDDRFHYIRYPLNWEKAKRNIHSFKTESPSNLLFHINCCIIPLNVYYVDELGNWLNDNFKSVNGYPVSYNFIRGEGTLDIAKTPMSLREEVWRRLPADHDISNVLKEVPVLDHNDMMSHLDKWDKHRNLDWRTVFPEIVKYFI